MRVGHRLRRALRGGGEPMARRTRRARPAGPTPSHDRRTVREPHRRPRGLSQAEDWIWVMTGWLAEAVVCSVLARVYVRRGGSSATSRSFRLIAAMSGRQRVLPGRLYPCIMKPLGL